MITRRVFLLFSLFVLMVQGDLDSNDVGIQTMSTDKDSTSDEAPTESMNAVSPEQLEHLYHGRGPSDTSSSSSEVADAPAANQVTVPEPAAAATNSVEEQDDESADSEEGGKKRFSSRSSKPPHRPTHIQRNPSQAIPHSFLSVPSPALNPQPIFPQSKTQLRSRMTKRRSRTNRHQI
ncbi:uncharacterized protein si:ch211-133n4.6 isoform X2 [Channa argus]|uniref:uncharacterized protein si:ch211-133n4.6 isoform X2 n=1 Tax=Channa argus TaxID=215402 RepID=UPI003522A541